MSRDVPPPSLVLDCHVVDQQEIDGSGAFNGAEHRDASLVYFLFDNTNQYPGCSNLSRITNAVLDR